MPGGHLLYAGILFESHLLGIGRPVLSKDYNVPLGSPRGPPEQPRVPEKPKVPQSVPRAAQTDSKGPQSPPTESKRRTINHKPIYLRKQDTLCSSLH